jgi:hypothetical protein
MRSNAVGGGYCTLSLAWDGAVMMPLQYIKEILNMFLAAERLGFDKYK